MDSRSRRGGEPGQPTAFLDLTALAPGASATALLEPEPDPDATRVGPPPLVASAPRPSRQADRRWLVALGVLALVALVVVLVLLLGSNSPSRLGSGTTTTTHVRATSTTTSTSTSTTTTVAGAPGALAALVAEVASGQSAGTIDQGSAQTISTQAEQAVSDASAGKSPQAAKDLQQAAKTVSDGVQHGKISAAEGTTLQSQLSALAAALGVSAAVRRRRAVPADEGRRHVVGVTLGHISFGSMTRRSPR